MNKRDFEQLFIVRSIKTSVLIWELLTRKSIKAIVIGEKKENKILHKDENGYWKKTSYIKGGENEKKI